MSFENEKRQALEKLTNFDKSRAGEIDSDIRPLIGFINSLPTFYTTSSCSGRVMAFSSPKTGRKDECRWLYVTHDKPEPEKILSSIGGSGKDTVWLRMESPIVHVCVSSLEEAKRLLSIANASGFRRAGAISLSRRIMLEISCPERLNVPIKEDGKLLVSREYISLLARKSHAQLKRSRKKLDRFYANLKKEYSKNKKK
jgi:tRNA wybutosine-synthesizing protein 3